jgi:hypothetical protein
MALRLPEVKSSSRDSSISGVNGIALQHRGNELTATGH